MKTEEQPYSALASGRRHDVRCALRSGGAVCSCGTELDLIADEMDRFTRLPQERRWSVDELRHHAEYAHRCRVCAAAARKLLEVSAKRVAAGKVAKQLAEACTHAQRELLHMVDDYETTVTLGIVNAALAAYRAWKEPATTERDDGS